MIEDKTIWPSMTHLGFSLSGSPNQEDETIERQKIRILMHMLRKAFDVSEYVGPYPFDVALAQIRIQREECRHAPQDLLETVDEIIKGTERYAEHPKGDRSSEWRGAVLISGQVYPLLYNAIAAGEFEALPDQQTLDVAIAEIERLGGIVPWEKTS